jgi:hypothetical protein
MTLPQIGSGSTMFTEEFDLLSLDESSFIDSKPNSAHNSFIHAKRIVVFGSSLPKEMGPDTSAAIMRMKSYLDGSPSLGRFRVNPVFVLSTSELYFYLFGKTFPSYFFRFQLRLRG